MRSSHRRTPRPHRPEPGKAAKKSALFRKEGRWGWARTVLPLLLICVSSLYPPYLFCLGSTESPEGKERGPAPTLPPATPISPATSTPVPPPPSQAPNRAILSEGVTLGQGLPFLSFNAIPYERGAYLFRGSSVEVYFLRRPLPVLESWTVLRCGGLTLYQVQKNNPSALAAVSDQGFSVLFVAPPEPWRCAFLELLMNRISTLYQTLKEGEPPLPAFLEIK